MRLEVGRRSSQDSVSRFYSALSLSRALVNTAGHKSQDAGPPKGPYFCQCQPAATWQLGPVCRPFVALVAVRLAFGECAFWF